MSASSKLISAGSAAAVAYLGWRSLAWPLVHDAPIMHYVAWLVSQGGVPYRDAFDMNAPGVYLLHWAVLAAAGAGDLAWRGLDLGWLLATSALLAAFARPLAGAWPATGAALLFALYHLSGGAWRAGQRDFLLCAFLLGGAHLVAGAVERGWAPRRLLAAGVCLGAGMTVKPHAGLYWLVCAAIAAWGARARGRAPAAAALVVAGGLLAPLLALAWLETRGAVAALAGIAAGYVLPLYGRVGRAGPADALGWYRFGWATWGLLLALAALALAAPAPRGAGARRALAALGALYGALHFLLQGKGWEYHLYPLAAFASALVAVAVRARPARAAAGPAAHAGPAPASGTPPGPRAASARRAGPWLARAAWAALVLLLGVKGVEAVQEPWVAEKTRRVQAMTRDLGRLVGPGDTVQVLDTTAGGVHALLRLGLRQPTRFLYDFHFFHDAGDPRIRRLRAELAADLAARPPAAVLVAEDDWLRPGYGRLAELPDVAAWLAQRYDLAVEGEGYRIYAKRRGP